MKSFNRSISTYAFTVLLLLAFYAGPVYCQESLQTESSQDSLLIKEISQKKKIFKMTTLTFGGNGVQLTSINNQRTVMTGGRGSATFNNRYTIGGGGWGMIKGVEAAGSTEGTYNFIKMGYGGVDLGYLFLTGQKLNIGSKVLLCGGAVFMEQVPDAKEKRFRMFPVVEPTLYCQITLSKLFRLELGAGYRLIRGTNRQYISDRELSGFFFYTGFLVKACNCK